MEWLQDCFGKTVRLTAEKLEHIRDHPEMVGLESEVSKVLASPELVLESRTDSAVKLFYNFYVQTFVGGKWLCVVVRYSIEPPDAFVVTAYLTNKPKQGKILWQKN
jgi:hypothetical protein